MKAFFVTVVIVFIIKAFTKAIGSSKEKRINNQNIFSDIENKKEISHEGIIDLQGEGMFLFFDTETTGLPKNWKAPVTDLDNWPRLVQLSYIISDKNGNVIKEVDRIIRPNEFSIPSESSKLHGITTEKALARGIDLKDALIEFKRNVERVSYCGGMQMDLANIDYSNHKKLEILSVKYNAIYTINLESNIYLRELNVRNCELKELDLSKNVLLERLDLRENKIETIDLSSNANLVSLKCSLGENNIIMKDFHCIIDKNFISIEKGN